MAAPRDPFYAVKDKVQASLSSLQKQLSHSDSLVTGGSAAREEIDASLSEARAAMSQIHVDVKDLSQTITIVEENRSRFPSIGERELESRRAFVTDAKTTLSQCDEQIKRVAARAQQQANQSRKKLLQQGNAGRDSGLGNSRFDSSAAAESSRANDDFISNSRMQMKSVEKEQDDVLITMSDSLDRLKGISESIGDELKQSEYHLGELESDIDQANGTMEVVLRKMDKLLKSSDKGRLCCIVILFVVAIALFLGIVYG